MVISAMLMQAVSFCQKVFVVVVQLHEDLLVAGVCGELRVIVHGGVRNSGNHIGQCQQRAGGVVFGLGAGARVQTHRAEEPQENLQGPAFGSILAYTAGDPVGVGQDGGGIVACVYPHGTDVGAHNGQIATFHVTDLNEQVDEVGRKQIVVLFHDDCLLYKINYHQSNRSTRLLIFIIIPFILFYVKLY